MGDRNTEEIISYHYSEETTSSQNSTVEHCTVCLSGIIERAVAYPCNHLSFDFICLVQWLQTSATCPLCKTEVKEVQYDFRSIDDFKRYKVPSALSPVTLRPDPEVRSSVEPSRQAQEEPVEQDSDPRVRYRRCIYELRRYSLHTGSNPRSGYRDFSVQEFANSSDLQSRARTFLRREVRALRGLIYTNETALSRIKPLRPRARQATDDYLTEYIVAVLRSHEPRGFDGGAEELVACFMSITNARILLHELLSWLRSPFVRLKDWDDRVQYRG